MLFRSKKKAEKKTGKKAPAQRYGRRAAVVWWLPISAAVKAILILGAAFPSAAIPVMLVADRLDEAQVAGKMLFFSTVFSGATIPLVLKLLQWGLGL